jgi:hypothetical protein
MKLDKMIPLLKEITYVKVGEREREREGERERGRAFYCNFIVLLMKIH